MTSALLIDIILIAIFSYFVYLGARNGFVKSVLILVAMIAALTVAFSVVNACSNTLADKFVTPAVSKILGEKADEKLGDSGDEVASTLVSASDKVEGIVEEIIDKDKEKTPEEIRKEEERKAKKEEIRDMDSLVLTVSDFIGRMLTAFILLVLVYALVSAVLRVAIDQLTFINKIPIIGAINVGFGIVLGAISGFIAVCVPVWAIYTFLPQLLNGESLFTIEEMSKSKVLEFVIEKVPFLTGKSV
ncbi:MAG: hypothetical protein GX633_00915 [Clostridiales bacterium]|nr:hypothetical protein [Clostridiales bacterium]